MLSTKLITNYNSLIMNQHGKVLEDFIHLINLLLNLLNTLFSLLDDCLIENNLIIQQQHLLPVHKKQMEASQSNTPLVGLNNSK